MTQVTLERETGVINGDYSDDLLFLRQLILDGQWDDVLEFIQPLASLEAFDHARFRFAVLKAKFVELLCLRGDTSAADSAAVDAVVEVLRLLEPVAPSREEHSALCLLLTSGRPLAEHPEYRYKYIIRRGLCIIYDDGLSHPLYSSPSL
jgi:hypothetical protein